MKMVNYKPLIASGIPYGSACQMLKYWDFEEIINSLADVRFVALYIMLTYKTF